MHRTTTAAVVTALADIFEGNRYADKVIEKALKSNARWGARDRRFIAETTYDIVRWYRLLRFVTGTEGAGNNDVDYWKLLGAWCILEDLELPEWQEFENLDSTLIRNRLEEAEGIRKVRESIPDWLDETGERELGAAWDRELRALNEQADVVLRVNTLKVTRVDLQKMLAEEKVKTLPLPGFPEALVLDERQNVFVTKSFRDGLFEVQDAASQQVAPFLRAEPGMRVIDACAGAGGKTLHLAALMKNTGRIIAMDVERNKLEELQKRARRAGASNVEARLIESSKAIKRLANSADRLLLDVPCSGLGVLRRSPDAKWKLSPEFLDKVKSTQAQIIRDYSAMVKAGGMIVYSTCSILPSENNEQVRKFIEGAPKQFELVDEKSITPSSGADGFYMALIRKVS